MDIAIIGSGISGLGAAYLLSRQHDIVLYEKNAYIGGHSRTIDIETQSGSIPVDTGFIVFNDWNYPNLFGLFDTIGVSYQKSDMSFGVSIDNGRLEYSSGALFAQRKNLIRPQYWRMLFDVFKFNKQALSYIEKDNSISLGDCLNQLGMSTWFKHYYVLAMGAAIWSCPVETIMEYPAATFLQFFKNHGLLNINDRPQWYTVTDGSRAYIEKLTASFKEHILLENGAQQVQPKQGKLEVIDSKGNKRLFDHVIFACHADQALKLIKQPHERIQQVLQHFKYQRNHIVVHSDTSYMPQHKDCWASWVYLSGNEGDQQSVSLSYWMNNLQNLPTTQPVLVTLNPSTRPNDALIHDEHYFSHPVFDYQAISAQQKVTDIQGLQNMWFCGAYQRYGFHEDGLLSAVNVAKMFRIDIPWE